MTCRLKRCSTERVASAGRYHRRPTDRLSVRIRTTDLPPARDCHTTPARVSRHNPTRPSVPLFHKRIRRLLHTSIRHCTARGGDQPTAGEPLPESAGPCDGESGQGDGALRRRLRYFMRKRSGGPRGHGKLRDWVEKAGLIVHPTKTRIVDASQKGGFDFLGYHFERGHRWPPAGLKPTFPGQLRADDAGKAIRKGSPRPPNPLPAGRWTSAPGPWPGASPVPHR